MGIRKSVDAVNMGGYRRALTIRKGGGGAMSFCRDLIRHSQLEGVETLYATPLCDMPGMLITTIDVTDIPSAVGAAPPTPTTPNPSPVKRGVMTWRRKMSANGNGRNIGLGAEMLRAAGLDGLYECDIMLCPDGLMIRRPVAPVAEAAEVPEIESPSGEDGLF